MSFEKSDSDKVAQILTNSIESSKALIAKYGPLTSGASPFTFYVDDEIVAGKTVKL